MTKSEITNNDCIHVKTYSEYKRIIDLFKIDDEYFMDWFYEEKTVIYPFTKEYGEVDGYCIEAGFNIIDSELIK